MNESSAPKLTPVLEQYLGIKAEHPDALLFFRMGDFYELFFEDAETAARELQIVLTSRNPGVAHPVPMCGVPYHACESYLSQLLDKGFKVAICDQVEDPRQAKGLVKRAVTRVLTPGTLVEDVNLEAKEHHYLAAIFWDAQADAGGLAWVDVSTGECRGVQLRQHAQLWSWANKLRPRELLLPEQHSSQTQAGETTARITPLPMRGFFEAIPAKERLLRTQGIADLRVLDLEDKPQLVQAFGALLTYLQQTQKRELPHLGPFKVLYPDDFLLLDEVTLRNLEIFRRLDGGRGPGTLRQIVDQTMTPMGGRLLETRLHFPWKEIAPVLYHQEAVAFFHEQDSLRRDLAGLLAAVTDLERIASRIALHRSSPRDFTGLRQGLRHIPLIEAILRRHPQEALPPALSDILGAWDNLEELTALLDLALVDSPPPLITEGGIFREGYHPDLDALLELVEHGQGKLRDILRREQEETGLNKLKLGYNRVFGYYFELPRALAATVPERFERRQSLASSERFSTKELKELEDRLLSAADERKSLEYRLFQELREQVDGFRVRVTRMGETIANLDVWQGLAQAARKWSWSKPKVHLGLEIRITGGRHPCVEAGRGAADYIPNDVALDEDRRILIITGPNMGGKSTVLRQTAIICILAQIGSFVPAAQASIGLTDRIFTRVGASDNLSLGQSTFMVEMIETARILRQTSKRSLVILDEIGRGTSTYDGLALAWAVVEELAKVGQSGVRTLFATHYHELTSLEGKVPGVRNYNIAVKEWKGEIIFLRRLVPGPSDRSYGIEVAKLAGVPRSVISRAKEILDDLDAKSQDKTRPVVTTRPVLLPGFSAPAEADPGQQLLKQLRKVDPMNTTPMQALTLLRDWKNIWDAD
jgi:DNA mismatch repair protein MutS